MSFYGPTETWKVVYFPIDKTGGQMGVALVEACSEHHAMINFRQQYAGQYTTVKKCEKLIK